MKPFLSYLSIIAALLLAALFASRGCASALVAGAFATSVLMTVAVCRQTK